MRRADTLESASVVVATADTSATAEQIDHAENRRRFAESIDRGVTGCAAHVEAGALTAFRSRALALADLLINVGDANALLVQFGDAINALDNGNPALADPIADMDHAWITLFGDITFAHQAAGWMRDLEVVQGAATGLARGVLRQSGQGVLLRPTDDGRDHEADRAGFEDVAQTRARAVTAFRKALAVVTADRGDGDVVRQAAARMIALLTLWKI